MGEIDVDPDRTSTVPAGVVVDAGGIGKGLAADLTVAKLLADGAHGALVGIGGDLAMAGTPRCRRMAGHPQNSPTRRRPCTLAVSGGGVATSSTRSRRWTIGGQSRHHVIDPAAGASSTTDLATVTVIARSGWLAEARHRRARVRQRQRDRLPRQPRAHRNRRPRRTAPRDPGPALAPLRRPKQVGAEMASDESPDLVVRRPRIGIVAWLMLTAS